MRSFTILKSLLLVILTLTLTFLLAESITGAPSSIIGYYFYDYDEVTSGVILRSRVRQHVFGATYKIEYEYSVSGNVYKSDKVNHSANYRTVAHTTAEKYPILKKVTVYYDSDNPRFSILEKSNLGYWIWGQLISGLFIFSIAIYYCFESLLNR